MSLGEFELIGLHFARCGASRPDTLAGVGDDAALMQIPDGVALVTAHAHAFPDTDCDGIFGAYGDQIQN